MKDRTFWDRINSIDYIDIIDIHDRISGNYKYELKNSKDQFVLIIMISAILIISAIIYIFNSPNKQIGDFNYLYFVILFFLVGIIYSIYMLKTNKTVLIISNNAIKIKDKTITWDRIKKMYVRKQNTGDGYEYTLIIELNIETKVYCELDGLEMDYNKIIYEVGKCYWNWKINNAT